MGERKWWNKNNGKRLLKKNKISKRLKKKKITTMTQTQTLVVSSKPFRRARTKIKKPKFLSLSSKNNDMQILSPPEDHQSRGGENTDRELKLFPSHHHHDDPDPPESMADHMFSEDGPGLTTLTGLLDGNGNGNGNGAVSSAASELSYAVVAAQDSVNSARSLVRTAMRRSRERESEESEEKWVSISEVVERRTADAAEEEVTSGGGGLWLKLDYEEVLNAWSAKGPFYVDGDEEEEEQPQIVPDLCFPQYGVVPFWGSVRNQGHWNVPEMSLNLNNKGEEEGWKMGIREASVLRYKEKRRNRLFSKRIRYEVRKLNAEKRPRIKGRFVKRSV